MRSPPSGPPRLAEWLLSLLLPGGGVRESVLGDLHEMWVARAATAGRGSATMWYWGHAARIALGYTVRRFGRGRPRGFAPPTRTWDGRGNEMIDSVKDVRYALRGMLRAPGFFAVALLTLALGIGANTAIFSVVNAIYLRPLDFREPDRLAQIGQSAIDGSWSMSTHTAGTWTDWADRQTSFETFAGYRYWTTTVERDGVVTRVNSVHSLGSMFDVLGVPAMLGRTFTAAEEGAGAENLVVLSHAYWQQEYGEEDPSQQALIVEGVPHEILGVMPPTFRFPTQDTQIWKTSDLSAEALLDREDQFVNSIGRLAPGRTLEDADSEMARVHSSMRAAYPEQLANTRPELVPLRESLLGNVGALWTTLMGAVAFVLLIACLNLANLLLSRSGAREGEIAVRRALGASRSRLTRLVVTENLTLSALGGLAGVGVGWLFLRGILSWMPGGVPRIERIGIDVTVLAFTFAVTGLAGLLFGVIPALRLSDGTIGQAIHRTRRGSTNVIRRGLVVGEIALAVVLVAAAGLTIRAYAAVSAVEPGFDPTDRTVFYVELPRDGTEGAESVFYRDLERDVTALPGVRRAGITSVYPMSGFTPGAWVGEPGVPVPTGDANPTARYVGISPTFRAAAGIPLLRGRDLAWEDDRNGTPALLLSETAAERFFPGEDALGQQIYLGPDGVVAPVSTVVGIVGDVRQTGLTRDVAPVAYVPRDNIAFWPGYHLVVEADRAGEALSADVRRVARGLGADAAVIGPTLARDYLASSMSGQRNVMLLFGLLATVALVMAAVGVFGVVAYLVSQRTREIGIRLAVGAARADVQGLVLVQSLLPAVVGAGVGIGAAVWLSRFMQDLVTGVEPTDPLTFVAVPIMLVGVAALASWIPARRASRVDPVQVLAGE